MPKKKPTIEERVAAGFEPFTHPDSVHVALATNHVFQVPYFKALVDLEDLFVNMHSITSQALLLDQADAVRCLVDAVWAECKLYYTNEEHVKYLRKLRRVPKGVPVTSCDLELELQAINDRYYRSHRMGLASLDSEPMIDIAKTMRDLGRILTEPNTEFTWQCNIAVTFQDEYALWKKSSKKRSPSAEDIHEISNKAAQRFISLLKTK